MRHLRCTRRALLHRIAICAFYSIAAPCRVAGTFHGLHLQMAASAMIPDVPGELRWCNGQPDVVQCRWAVLPSNLAGRMKPDLEIGRLAPEPQNPEHPASSRPPICSLPLRCTAKFWLLNRASDDRPAAVRALCSSPLHRRRPAHKSAAQIALPPLQRFEAVTQSMQNALRPAGRELAVPCLKSHPDDDDLCQVPAGIPDPQ